MEAAAGYCWSPKIRVRGATRRNPPSLVPGLTFRAFVSLKILGVPLSAPRRFCIAPLFSSSSPLVSPLPSPESSHDGKEFVPVSSAIPEISEPTIRVRFILKRECSFGEKFFLVGEDPALGSWEPSMAIPMNWSEGHTWSIEQDIPIGSKVQFKFIMKNASGEVKWQPGPDRVLNLWETDKTILVEEDWEAAEVQKVTKELPEEPFMQSPVAVAEEVKPDELAENYDAMMGHFIENSEDPVLVPSLSSMSIIGAAEQTSEEKQDETASVVETGSTVGEHLTPIFLADDEAVDIDIPQML